jgi:hypothetical protein
VSVAGYLARFVLVLPLGWPRKTSKATSVAPTMNNSVPTTTVRLGYGRAKLATSGACRPKETAAPLRNAPERQMATPKRTKPTA